MFNVNPRVNLYRIILTVLFQKSEKQWKVLGVCLENLPMGGPSGNQTDYPRDLPRPNFS